jgi:putative ubiquitin-RnfH superfamily antitoxin RatB of RatAB toxin-antitoxin module
MTALKRCLVAYATREHQHLWSVELPASASVADALEAAQRLAALEDLKEEIPWETAAVGIFGEPCARCALPADGDRIEIYRPLAGDPRERRRARVRKSSR